MSHPETATVRVAMWSGPRNLSTAMMRSFENRADCSVVDEPLYAAYLAATGLDHPGRDEVVASQPTDPAVVLAELVEGPLATPLQYQKHMTHHLLPGFVPGGPGGRGGPLGALRHAFLVRDPERVLTSYAKVRDEPTLEDLGLPQQVELFETHGGPVVDAADVLRDPRGTLGLLCAALGLAFDEAMLAWPAGPRGSDGVWAPHWYAGVEASTGFATDSPGAADPLPDRLRPLLERCRPYYDALAPYRLSPDTPPTP
ncbi:HAD family hydrolase [Nocardioides sp. AX2bis]|uniref:sulfotransferase-like domain-containing protein n=1 Tax=Nocardioides sp. AX2bis TaxID=2653157 RepID=UPI001F2D7F7F|nr:HAD family hydrolase [Nocardioides sp. AX2bis]